MSSMKPLSFLSSLSDHLIRPAMVGYVSFLMFRKMLWLMADHEPYLWFAFFGGMTAAATLYVISVEIEEVWRTPIIPSFTFPRFAPLVNVFMWIFVASMWVTIAASILLMIVYLGLNFYHWVDRTVRTLATQKTKFVVEATLAVGLLLFWFRYKYRMVYGITEAGVGLYVAYGLATKEASPYPLTDPAFIPGYLTAAVYLVVRGLDNVHQGVSKDPRDALYVQLETKLKNLLMRIGIRPRK
jgi:hypothetical protein